MPLFVMLHGCSQSADELAAVTAMNQYAERERFLVLYPEQPLRANARHCWNWFRPENQVRDRGEPAEIVGIVRYVQEHYTIDCRRIYAVGISAGAAMTVTLGATYPDVFAALGVCSGVAYKAATTFTSAVSAMRVGSAQTRVKMRGDAVYQAMGEHQRMVPLILFHGLADTTVVPINAQQLITQWTYTARLSADGISAAAEPMLAESSREQPADGRTYLRQTYEGADGETIIAAYFVEGMGHAWPGGRMKGAFSDPAGPDASRLIVDFCLNRPLGIEPLPSYPIAALPAQEPVPRERQRPAHRQEQPVHLQGRKLAQYALGKLLRAASQVTRRWR